MRLLTQPIEEAFEILKRDNPTCEHWMAPHGGIWLKPPDKNCWFSIVAVQMDGRALVPQPGERTLTMGDADFRKYMMEEKAQ